MPGRSSSGGRQRYRSGYPVYPGIVFLVLGTWTSIKLGFSVVQREVGLGALANSL